MSSGRISLSVASRAQTCFRRARKQGFPKDKREAILKELSGKKIREADRILATHFPLGCTPQRIRPLDAELTRLEFSVNRDLLERLEKILSLRSHTNPEKRLEISLADLIELGLRKWDPGHPRWRKPRSSDHALAQ